MDNYSKNVVDTSDREIVISRLLHAPRELVWEAFTKPEHIIHWWGPTGFTNTIHSMEVKPGGIWNYIMHGPNGMDFPNRVTYIEVIEPALLVYDHGDDIDDDPNRFHVRISFDEQDGKTLLTMASVFPTAAQRDMVVKEYGAIEGGNQTMDKLATYLQTM